MYRLLFSKSLKTVVGWCAPDMRVRNVCFIQNSWVVIQGFFDPSTSGWTCVRLALWPGSWGVKKTWRHAMEGVPSWWWALAGWRFPVAWRFCLIGVLCWGLIPGICTCQLSALPSALSSISDVFRPSVLRCVAGEASGVPSVCQSFRGPQFSAYSGVFWGSCDTYMYIPSPDTYRNPHTV